MKPLITAAVLCAALAAFAAASVQDAEAPDPLFDLAWMAGHWSDVEGPRVTEELWMAPRGGLMLGLHRDHDARRQRASFEYLRIEVRDGAIVYQASPAGQPPTPFPLVSLEPGHAVFENPQHDFPQRIVYRLEGELLVVRAEADAEGGPRGLEWRWKRGAPSDD